MMGIIKKNKIIVLVIIVILVGILLYSMLNSGGGSDSLLTSETVGNSQADKVLVDELLQLRSIRLDGAIFADPAFASLRDSGVDIVSEPIGRRNPFAPLGEGGSSGVPATTATATTTAAGGQ
jgi:hypothetical protein